MKAHATPAATPVAAAEQVVAQSGHALDAHARAVLEPAFGADFSDVRVHTDAAAAEAAAGLDADAFVVGNHMVFGEGAYRPSTPSGQEVLHHELAHVLQQRGAPASSGPLDVGDVDSTAEWAAARGEVVPVASRLVQRTPQGQPATRWITDVYVDQAGQSQTVRWRWSNTGMDPRIAPCSAGKGHCCCEDPAVPACSAEDTRVNDSNYTPVGDFPVVRPRHSNHPPWWTEFVPDRAIALHQYTPVDGTPLSHGCVRMHDADARIVHGGARIGRTMVHVTGLPTPLCRTTSLQQEWAGDYTTATTESPDGEERKALRSAHGINDAGLTTELAAAGTPATGAGVASRIPRCLPGRGLEEDQVAAAPTRAVPTTPGLAPFVRNLRGATTEAQATTITRQFGRTLWQAARARAQRATNPDLDDRPLYWGRLRAQSAIRAWQPRIANAPDIRRRAIPRLLQVLEESSRGLDEYTFPTQRTGGRGAQAPGTKRIVVSGFDPFGGAQGSIDQANPSASAVLALDGTLVDGRTSSGGVVRGRVEGVVFPVRYDDFDRGIVERAVGPHLAGANPADLVMTISRGGSQFEVEEQAGRRRSSRARDNAGRRGNTMASGSSPVADAGPAIPGGTSADPEFIRTNASASTLAGLRGGIPRTGAIPEETDVQELDPSTGATARTATPTPGRLAVEGAGGGFLSNEIFYRVSRRRAATGAAVPVVHLHVPQLAGVDPPAERRAVVDTVRNIVAGALPTL